jgi:hypothetical protein
VSARAIVRRLEAWQEGRPLADGETLRFPVVDDPDLLMVAFVRMGGESRPWAIGFVHPGEEPAVLVAPDGRNRDLVASMAVRFSKPLLDHLVHPKWPGWDPESNVAPPPLRQVWVPNGAHVEMLHMLDYAFTFAGRGQENREDPERILRLNALGRACGWLFREGQRPGSVTVMDASSALRDVFTFPADDLRQRHLGFLLAWLKTEGDRAIRAAAAEEAERQSVSTSLDPKVERDELEPLVERFVTEQRSGAEGRIPAAEIEAVLRLELSRRLTLCEEAITLLRQGDRPVNPGVDKLVALAREEFRWGYWRMENPPGGRQRFVPSPDTDRTPVPAASNFLKTVYSEEVRAEALIHHDRELQREAVATGDAFEGEIVAVEDRSPADSRAKRPYWVVESESDGPLRLREGSSVCLAGVPKRDGKIRAVERLEGGGRRVEIEIGGWKRARPADGQLPALLAAHDAALVGERVLLLTAPGAEFSNRKRFMVRERSGAGAWLTHDHGARPHPVVPSGDDLVERVDRLRGAA